MDIDSLVALLMHAMDRLMMSLSIIRCDGSQSDVDWYFHRNFRYERLTRSVSDQSRFIGIILIKESLFQWSDHTKSTVHHFNIGLQFQTTADRFGSRSKGECWSMESILWCDWSVQRCFPPLHLSFSAIAIETMTAKTGNFKSFSVFVNMLENAINQVGEFDEEGDFAFGN